MPGTGGLMAGNSAEPGRSVTSKVVAILLAFHDGSEHSLTEIAQLTCLPVSTAHRLVTELAAWGVLERTEESRFRVGLPIKAMLAFSPAGTVDAVIGGGLDGYTPNTVTDPEQLRRCLASIRLTRVAIARWELRCGVSEVAVPVFGAGGLAVAAVGLQVPHLRADLHMASSVLTVAARGLSRELAASSHP